MSIVNDALEKAKGAAQGVMQKAIALAPDAWIPGGVPDPLLYQQHGHVGKPIDRIDGPLKVSGKARFSAEFPMDGMLYAAIAFSTVAKGRITAIDAAAAKAAPGVVLVMTHENVPTMKPMPLFMTNPKAAGGTDLPIMDDMIHWNGQPIAVVLAKTQEQADHAKSLIRASYDTEPAVTALATAKANGANLAEFQGQPLQLIVGKPEDELAKATHKVDNVYTTPRHNHNPIELHGCTVKWEGNKLRVHDASQAVQHHAWSLGQIFGIGEDNVHVTSPFVGGGFGSKTLWYHQPLAAAASKLAGVPVRLNLSREGVYRTVGGRTVTEQRVALGADADGTFTALIHTGIAIMTHHNAMPEPFIAGSMSSYGSNTRHLEVRAGYMDMLANTFMRAPGEAPGTFGLESAIDELAHAMGMDPIELRMKNEPERDPSSNLPFSQRDVEKAYRMGAEAFGWEKRQAPGARRDGEWLIGMGVATGTYPYYRMPGGAARITLARDGRARVEIAAHEMGMGTATAHTQATADRLGLELEEIDFAYGDNLFPGVVLAGGSQQTASIGASVIAAQKKLYAELLKLAGNHSPLAGLSVDEVGGYRGGIAALDDPAKHESYRSILTRADRSEVCADGEAPAPLELQHWSMHSHSAIFAEMAVNTITGEPRVRRLLGSFDCGRILNPKTAASQFRGGMIMGLGLALFEETMFDERSGRIMNPSLAEYHVPVHLDVPQIDVIWTDIPDPHSPMGARGVGEIGITGVGAAVANAIFNATGKRVRDLPITLDKFL